MNLCFESSSERKAYENENTKNSKKSGMLFRTYSELDLYELKEIDNQIKEKAGTLSKIDPEAILSTYEGRTIFSIYFDTIQVYE